MSRKNRRARLRAASRSLQCEFLEDRRVLATFTVGDLSDTPDANPGDGFAEDAAGNTTLRAAIEEANALLGADEIDFSAAGTVTLSLGELTVTDDLSIDGGGATVDAALASRVMNLTGGTVALSNMTVTNGADARGAGIYSSTDLRLTNVTVSGSSASSAGGGIASMGGMLSLDASTVDGNFSAQYGGGIFAVQGSVSVMNNSVISGNVVMETTGAYSSGAGISVGNQTYLANTLGAAPFDLTVDNSSVEGNVLYGTNFAYGAALYSFGYGTMTITNSSITGNSATGANGTRGGAGFNWPAGAFGAGSSVINISDTVIDGNYSSEDSAGFGFRAFGVANSVEMNMTGVTITNNTALGTGGAGFNWSTGGTTDPAGSNFTISDSTISGNSAGGVGGAFQVQNTFFTVTDSTIDGNSAAGNGGAVYAAGATLDDYALSPPIATFTRTTISNNYSAANGGGVYGYDSGVALDNSTISGNDAAGAGGGVVKRTYYSYTGTSYETFVDLSSSTVTDNNANGTGGGFYADYYSTLRFNNSIISGNADGGGAAPDLYDPYGNAVSMYSLIGNATGSSLLAANPDAMGNVIGDTAGPIDAMLGALANNGGTTMTHLPMAGSPAIDAGDPAAMGGTDQTGGSRVNDGRIDMGSVETGIGMGVTGDFNGDGEWDCDDIDALSAESAAGTNTASFDMNGDMVVNFADIEEWLSVAGAINLLSGNAYAVGDATLDGVVDGLDFIEWNDNKFTTNTSWCGGNFNGDGVTDGLDFIDWNDNKFTQQGPITQSGPGATTDSLGDDSGTNVERRSGKQVHRMRPARFASTTTRVATLDAVSVDAAIGDTNRIDTPQLEAAVRTPAVEARATHEITSMSDTVSHAEVEIADIDLVFAGF